MISDRLFSGSDVDDIAEIVWVGSFKSGNLSNWDIIEILINKYYENTFIILNYNSYLKQLYK